MVDTSQKKSHSLNAAPDRAITVRPTTDITLIDAVFLALKNDLCTDQFDTALSVEHVIGRPEFTFLRVNAGSKLGGIIMMVGDELHTAFLPILRGAAAVRAGRAVLDWIRDNTELRQVRSYAYSHRPEVSFFARIMGFSAYETVDDGTTIKGVPVMRTNFVRAL